MKSYPGESNGPVLPVWRTLKGLSSRSGGLNLAGGDGEQSYTPPLGFGEEEGLTGGFLSPQDEPFSPDRLAHLDSAQSIDIPVLPEDAPPPPGDFGGALSPPKIPWGLSASTTSTSLSNLQNGVQRKRDHLQPTDDDDDDETPTAFSLFSGLNVPLLSDLYRHTRLSSKKVRRRVVHKNGDCNITQSNVAKRRRRYLQDIFTTLVDIQWRWTLLVFAMSFFLSWLGFAVMWYGISIWHGDLLPEHMPQRQPESGWIPCVINIYGFASCFLFSIETQHTIGYGSRFTTEQCPQAIFVMCIQSITGVMIQAFMVGVVFAKLSRPKKRTQTLMFSRNACVLQRDGELCLLFRVGDMRKSHIIEAHVRAQLIKKRVTREGETMPFFQYEMNVGYDVGEDRLFFIWPMTVVHKIDETSPLYDVSAHDLLREKFEIVVMLEGVIESTGMTTQARTSYLPNEILWGYRFEPLVFFNKDTGEYAVDYSLFNNTLQVSTPLCSARHLDQCRSRGSTPESDDGNALPTSGASITANLDELADKNAIAELTTSQSFATITSQG